VVNLAIVIERLARGFNRARDTIQETTARLVEIETERDQYRDENEKFREFVRRFEAHPATSAESSFDAFDRIKREVFGG
jgi:hypothetical protein